MSRFTTICKSCEVQITGEQYHGGFSDMTGLYCSICPNVLLFKDRDLIVKHQISWPILNAGDEGWEPYNQHLLHIYEAVEQLFKPCECGGKFQFMNAVRCPECLDFLHGDLYLDKPIFKERDLYIHVTKKSVSDIEHLAIPN